jgi:hypothetical protein
MKAILLMCAVTLALAACKKEDSVYSTKRASDNLAPVPASAFGLKMKSGN